MLEISSSMRLGDYENVLKMIEEKKISNDLKIFLKLKSLFLLKKYDKVVEEFEKTEIKPQSSIKDLFLFYYGVSLCNAKGLEEGEKKLKEISPDSDLVRDYEIKFSKGDCLIKHNGIDRAKEIFFDLLNNYKNPEIREMALVKIINLKKNKTLEKTDLKKYVGWYPEFFEAEEFINDFTDSEKLSIIKKLFFEREYEKLHNWFISIKDKNIHDDAAYYEGVSSFRMRDDYNYALKNLINNKSSSHSHYLTCISYGKIADFDKGIKCCDEFLKKFPRDPLRIEVFYQKARFLYAKKDYKNAVLQMEDFFKIFKKIPDRTRYYWFLGWFKFREGNFKEAVEIFNDLSRSKKTLVGDKANYWIGRIYEMTDRKKDGELIYNKVIRKYPYSYYAYLSLLRLKKMGGESPSFLNRDFSSIKVQEIIDWRTIKRAKNKYPQHLDEIFTLIYGGELKKGEILLEKKGDKLKKLMGKRKWMLFNKEIEKITKKYDYYPSKRFIELSCMDIPPNLRTIHCWRIPYPLAYQELVKYEIKKYSLSEFLIYSLMLQESRFNPYAISGAPAYGLLQIIRRTAKKIAMELNMDYKNSMLFLPEISIKFAIYYIHRLVKEFKGQIPLAIAAYNGGPLYLREELQKHRGLPFDEFIEEIEAHQTRNYVRKVLEHFIRYLYLYASPKERNAILHSLIPKEIDYDPLYEVNY